ncbi:MAG TPA: response regulator [Kofleriaceae bacterium]|jgi:CheY-like chemotaxis protein|nr:response regulator [Kofleriaceae bacterium]
MASLGQHRTLIAVVDDDREVREYLDEVLRRAGYEVALASNGLRLVSALQVDRPDLILLDVNMSWIDGFELCRALKKNPQWQAIPVVFVSGRTAPADVEEGLACGAVGFFPKPIDGRALIDRVRELVQPGRT